MAEHATHPTALVFGKAGMGKSYLCNFLLYGSGRGKGENRFVIGKGRKAVTSECKSQSVPSTESPPGSGLQAGGPLKMIDTPGIPDPQGRTLDFYDEIVHTLREAGGLNAFIMLLNDANDRETMEKDLKTYRILLSQFAKLPVFKVAVCRVKPDLDATEEEQKDDLDVTKKSVMEILQHGGMESAQQVYIMEDPRVMKIHYFRLRALVTGMPWVPVGSWNVKTYSELKKSAERLLDHTGRIGELRQKKRDLESDIDGLTDSIAELNGKIQEADDAINWTLAVAGGTALTGFGLFWGATAGLAYLGVHSNNKENYKKQIVTNELQVNIAKKDIDEIDRELEGGVARGEDLARDKKVLDDLESLCM